MAKGKTKKVEVEVPEIFSDGLVQLLKAWPHVKTVWLNEKGDFHLTAQSGFTPYDVSEIFEANAAAPVEKKKVEVEEVKTEVIPAKVEEVKTETAKP